MKAKTGQNTGAKENSKRENPKLKAVLPENQLAEKVIEILEKGSCGLTHTEIHKKSGVAWLRGLAKKYNASSEKAGTSHAQAFLYDLWKQGAIFTEPPKKGQKACRFWALQVARSQFPHLSEKSSERSQASATLSIGELKSAYDKFVPQHGGFVPIYKVRREMMASREAFDNMLRTLSEIDDPVFELAVGDPSKYTSDQVKDSLRKGGILFLRIKWR